MYYAYELINPINNTPFYVGKGKQHRAYFHLKETLKTIKNKFNQETRPDLNWHKINTIKTIISSGLKIRYCFYSCSSEELALKKEKELINQWGRRDNNTGVLTNLTNGGDGGITRKVPVSQYNIFGELIKDWDSAKEAGLSLDPNYSCAITSCCRGKELSWKGFLWSYKGTPPNLLKHKRIIYQWSLTGELINRYSHTAIITKEHNYDSSTINNCIKGKLRTAYGFVWTNAPIFNLKVRVPHSSSIKVKNLTTGETYNSALEAAKAMKLKSGGAQILLSCKIKGRKVRGNKFAFI